MQTKNIYRITHIDYSILGLLRQNSMSGYAIRMIFEKTALGNFSSSPGTIYPALKKLEGLQLIEKKKYAPTEKQAPYTITTKGINSLNEWLMQLVTKEEVAKNLNIILLRFAFMDVSANREIKKKFLESFKEAVSSYSKELEEYHSKESMNMPLSGRLVFEHGIESYKATYRWIQKVITINQAKN